MTATTTPKNRPDKRDVLAQAILDGCPVSDLPQRFIAAGYSEKAAHYEAGRALKDPLFNAAKTISNRVSKRDWTLDIYRRLHETETDGDRNIPVVDKIEPEIFFRDFHHRNRPVKLTGLVDHWPAMKRWTFDYLAEKIGNNVIEIQGQRLSGENYELVKDRHKRHVAFGEFIKLLRQTDSSNDFYITAYNDTVNKRALAPLWQDVGDIALLKASGGQDGFFWIGPKGTITPFHHDLTNNLLLQISGRKKVKMVAAYDLPQMRNHQHCFSLWASSEEITAQGENAPTIWECEIGPGEAIFLPVGWWHHVEALDHTIGMSFTNFPVDNDFYTDYPGETAF
ncbi:cupin-like domain-containing protein [Parasphingorhabdus sp. NYA22]